MLCALLMITETISSEVITTAQNMNDKSKIPSNVLMCRQWWKVCWIYGDQEKYYRYLYGSRKKPQDGQGDFGAENFKIPKVSSASTSTTTAVLTLQQQKLIFQNRTE